MTKQRIQSKNNFEFEIPAQAGKIDLKIKVKLDERRRAKYDVWQKDIPHIPSMVTVEGSKERVDVNWFNNFGLKRRPTQNAGAGTRNTEDSDDFLQEVDAGDDYDLELTAQDGKRYFLYVGNGIAREMSIVNGKATIRLVLGDPPIGDYPK